MSPALAGDGPPRLMILGDDYPRVFFFRASEQGGASGKVAYADWDKSFNRLMGIMGKSLDEELAGRSKNIEFFTRFKKDHPDQVVLLHFNGNARDPRWENQRFFAGHWLYFDGAKILSGVAAGEKESVLKVADASLFQTGIGRYQDANEDVGLCALGADGKPNWQESEQVQLVAVDRAKNTIRVRRGCYGTPARAFAAGQAYAAAHCSEGPWGKGSALLWYYNYATTCPKDAHGRTCSDVLVTQLAELFGPGGALAAFDGLEFDVLFNSHASRQKRGPDCDADGQADGGLVNGVNVYGNGVVEYCRHLRAALGAGRIIQADGSFKHDTEQRAFKVLNGMESEGWPCLGDTAIQDWSGGLNRHFFWDQNAFPLAFTYINHKFTEPGKEPGVEKRPEVPFHIHRLVFAAGVFTDSAICYAYPPPGGSRTELPIWDEFIMGADNRLRWLGQPRGPAVRLAAREPDTLRGAGQPIGPDLLKRFESAEAQLEIDQGALKLTAKDPKAAEFRARLKGVPCDGPDLFVSVTARAAQARNFPPEMARLMYAGIAAAEADLLDPARRPVTGMARRGQKEQEIEAGSGARVEYQERIAIGSEAHACYYSHPPYREGKPGYVFWQRSVSLPADATLEFFTALSANGAAKGDGVTFIVQLAPERDGQAGALAEVFRAHEKTHQWTRHTVSLAQWAGQRVRLKFISDCGPNDNTVADQNYWGDVSVLSGGAKADHATKPVQFMSWVNEKDFASGYYFNDVRSRQVDLEFVFESAEPVWLSAVHAHAHADAVFREFEHGLVLANPSPRAYTFDLERLFPGQHFRRLKATPQQDTKANDGSRVGPRLVLAAQEGLFLVRE